MRFPSERYLLRNGQNGRRALQAQDARAAHENRLLDVRDGASYHRVFAALNLTRRERRLAFAKRLYTGELPDAALHAFADWNMREMLDEAVCILIVAVGKGDCDRTSGAVPM
jgi:hypothetical protein